MPARDQCKMRLLPRGE